MEKAVDRNAKMAKGGDKDATRKRDLFERMRKHLDAGKPVRSMGLTKDEKADSQELHLLTAQARHVRRQRQGRRLHEQPASRCGDGARQGRGRRGGRGVRGHRGRDLASSRKPTAPSSSRTWGSPSPGLNRVIRAGYELLGLQTYFTAGEKEVRAWTVRAGSTAPQAAGVIHTDFERGFIRAEVIAYDDYIKYKGEAGSTDAGKLRLEGKEYIVKEGDVMHFRFNV